MADFSALKTAIQNAIRTNGNNEITGQLLQDILLSMVVVLGDEAITNVADDLSTETSQRQNADGTLQGNINGEATARATADAALQNAINTINSNFSNGYVYAGIATPSATPATGKVFYIATTAGTYTNFGGLTVTKGINILKYNGSSWSQEQIIGIDDYPTAGSSGLALSGGIDAEIKSLVGYYTCGTAAATAAKTIAASAYILLQGGSIKVKFTYKNTAADATLKIGSADAKPLFYGGRRAGSSNSWEAGEVVEIFYDGTNYMANNVMGGGAGDGVFDISVYNAVDGTPTPYNDLNDALGVGGANVPENYRKGGMSIKFVCSSDNKYVQYRLMKDEFSTDTEDWSIAEEGVYVENPEFIYVKTDAEDKILWAIKVDGSIYYGAGVPQQVVDYINERIADFSIDEYEDIVAFLNGLEEGDKTLQTLLNEKVDKEEGKSLINADYASSQSAIDNPEYLQVTTDNEGRILGGRKTDGTMVENVGIKSDDIQFNKATGNILNLDELNLSNTGLAELKIDLLEADAFANQEFVTQDYKSPDLFSEYYTTGKYYGVGHNGISTADYGGAAILKREYGIKLKSGFIYNVESPFVTDACGDLLYSEEGVLVDAFSIARSNANKIDSYKKGYQIDLANKYGDYYLCPTVANYQSSTASLSVKGVFRKESQKAVDTYSNDLESNIDNSIVKSSSYGAANAEYELPIKDEIFRLAVDFQLKTDVNVNGNDIPFIKVAGSNSEFSTDISITRQKPSLLVSSYVNDDTSYVQELAYNSKIVVNENPNTISPVTFTLDRAAKNYKPFRGVGLFSIWLKGAFTDIESAISSVSDRAAWLETNQDYALVIENDTLSIVRDGIDYKGEEFNGGATSTIFTTSLKTDGNYKQLYTLYNELSALDYLSVRMLDMSTEKTCEDIAQFGKVKLVGRYNQQIDRSSDTTDYYFDSYPFIIRSKVDTSIHTAEIVSSKRNDKLLLYVAIDGALVSTLAPTLSSKIVIGNADGLITVKNLSLYNGYWGEHCSLVTNGENNQIRIISDRTPCLAGVMGHVIYDTYKGSGIVVNPGTNVSVTHVEDVMNLINKKGYTSLNFTDLNAYIQSKNKRSPRSVIVIYDDNSIPCLWENFNIRNRIEKYGIKQNCAIVHSQLGAHSDKILPMALHGWECCTHSLSHDVPIPRKNSIICYYELYLIKEDCDTKLFCPNVFVYNWSGKWENTYTMLELFGYIAAINSSGNYSFECNNPYILSRIPVSDDIELDYIDNVLL